MNHGIVDVFAYQEALLIEAVFAVALLVMIWAGFRRWLQYKERMAGSSPRKRLNSPRNLELRWSGSRGG